MQRYQANPPADSGRNPEFHQIPPHVLQTEDLILDNINLALGGSESKVTQTVSFVVFWDWEWRNQV